ncbi:MAG: PLDc N-terminal domain-containing protein [Acidimicrobiia bacterium]|nr:PLDc N-terminal domain-containing protein [Acidimicrobiia bacterium]
MEVGIFFGLMVFMVVPFAIFHIWAVIDVLKTPPSVWEAAEQNQIVWAIVVLALAFLGPILYLVIARPQLRVATDRANVVQ